MTTKKTLLAGMAAFALGLAMSGNAWATDTTDITVDLSDECNQNSGACAQGLGSDAANGSGAAAQGSYSDATAASGDGAAAQGENNNAASGDGNFNQSTSNDKRGYDY